MNTTYNQTYIPAKPSFLSRLVAWPFRRRRESQVAALRRCQGNLYRVIGDQTKEILRLKEYSDQLADGLPEGMLPADVQNLRDANVGFAFQVNNQKKVIDDLRRDIKELSDQLVSAEEGNAFFRSQQQAGCDMKEALRGIIKEQDKKIQKLKGVLRKEKDELQRRNDNQYSTIRRVHNTRVGKIIDEQEKEIAELRAKVKWFQTLEPWTHLAARQKLTKAIREFLVSLMGYPRVVFNGVSWPKTEKLEAAVREYGTE
jgi:chromosome segregation ATPase